jgi:ribonuclease HI
MSDYRSQGFRLDKEAKIMTEKKVDIYSDASSDFTLGISAIGFLVETDDGIVRSSGAMITPFSKEILVTEGMALAKGLEQAVKLGYSKVSIHTDSIALKEAILTPTGGESLELKRVLRKIRKLCRSLDSLSIRRENRSAMILAHQIAFKVLECERKRQE